MSTYIGDMQEKKTKTPKTKLEQDRSILSINTNDDRKSEHTSKIFSVSIMIKPVWRG